MPCVLFFKGGKSLINKVTGLLEFSDKASFNDSKAENPAKKRKLDSEDEADDKLDQWLFLDGPNIILTMEDKDDIENGRRLNDKHCLACT